MEGRWQQENGLVIEITPSHILYKGYSYPHANVSPTVCYNKDGNDYWYYFVNSSGVLEVVKYGGGHLTANRLPDGRYQQNNGTILEFTPFSVIYNGNAFEIKNASPTVRYNKDGQVCWYYFEVSPTQLDIIKWMEGFTCATRLP